MIILCRNIEGYNWALVLNPLLVGGLPLHAQTLADKFNHFNFKNVLCATKERVSGKEKPRCWQSFIYSPDREGPLVQGFLVSITGTDLLYIFKFIVIVSFIQG
jgi:hypothetical protein